MTQTNGVCAVVASPASPLGPKNPPRILAAQAGTPKFRCLWRILWRISASFRCYENRGFGVTTKRPGAWVPTHVDELHDLTQLSLLPCGWVFSSVHVQTTPQWTLSFMPLATTHLPGWKLKEIRALPSLDEIYGDHLWSHVKK